MKDDLKNQIGTGVKLNLKVDIKELKIIKKVTEEKWFCLIHPIVIFDLSDKSLQYI